MKRIKLIETITITFMLALILIVTLNSCDSGKPVETEPCAHEWAVVYMNETSKLQTIECKVCHEVKTEPINPQDIPSPTPDIAKICMHTNHEVVADFKMGFQHNVYHCKDCGNYWEIQSDEITRMIVEEWSPEAYESAELTWPAN